MTEITKRFINRDMAAAKAAAIDWLDTILAGQWYEISASRTKSGDFCVKVTVRND